MRRFAGTVESANTAAFNAYEPRAFDGDLTIVLSRETTARYTDDPGPLWERLARGTVTLVMLSGEDGEMMKEPGASNLAELLRLPVG